MRCAPFLLAAAALALSPGAASGQAVADTQLASFDAAWRIVHQTHFDTSFNGVDWRALGDSLRPRAIGAPRDTIRTLVRAMLSRLGQSHFALFNEEDTNDDPEERAKGNGTAGLEVRLVDGRVTITQVDPAGAAAAAGVRPGWIITAVDTNTVERLLERLRARPARYSLSLRVVGAVNSWLAGRPDSALRLALLDGADRPVTRTVVRRRDPSEPVKWGHFPTFFARFASREERREQVTAGVIWFNNWLVPLIRQVDSAVDRYRGLDGIVLDLRGNTGGVGAMVSGVAGHFTPSVDTLGQMRTRSTTLYFISNPRLTAAGGRRVQPYAGPVAVLMDEVSGSASEVFTGGMQAIGRVRVFGATSIGGVLPATWDKLPNGDVLYHAFGEFVTATGERPEGRGIIPDEPVTITRADLLAGRDPALDAAMRWITAQKGARSPGGIP